jgi:hypothetical protein
MNSPLSAHRLAERLLEHEAEDHAGASEVAEAAGGVCSRLREQFARLVGPSGCDLLLTRAVSQARAAHPSLNGVRWQAGESRSLEGLAECVEGENAEEVRAASAAIVGGFLSLLFSFIGEDLTLRQVQRLWPDLVSGEGAAAPDPSSRQGENGEHGR